MRGGSLQTFKNISSPNRENLGEILTVLRRKNVKSQSMVTAKHKFQRLICNPVNQTSIDFLDELQKLAKNAFVGTVQVIIEQFIYAKMPPNLKKSINQAHLENGTYEQIVSHLERELELNGLEAPDELQKTPVTQHATKLKPEKLKSEMSPLEKARPLLKSMPPAENGKRPSSKQHLFIDGELQSRLPKSQTNLAFERFCWI